jgi:hypothetical protein
MCQRFMRYALAASTSHRRRNALLERTKEMRSWRQTGTDDADAGLDDAPYYGWYELPCTISSAPQ